MDQTSARRAPRRRHAAGRARVMTAVLSVAAFLGLGLRMAVGAATTATASSVTTSTATSSTSASSDQSSTPSSMSWSLDTMAAVADLIPPR